MAHLLDPFGNPIDFDRLRQEESGPTVTGVRPVLSDHPWVGMTPFRLGQALRAAEEGDAVAQGEIAEDMEERDPHYRAVLSTRRLQVSQLPITIEAAGDEADDQRAADLARELLLDSGVIADYLFDQLDAVAKGYSVGEIVWRTGTRRWEPARIEWRDPRWFRFDPADGRTLLLRGGAGGLGTDEPLKPFGYVAHIHKTKSGLPIRGGLMRPAAFLVLFKSLDVKSWLEFLEGFGQPVRLGKYRPGATDKDKDALLRAVRSMWKDSAAILPEGMAIEWLEVKSTGTTTRQQDFADWVDRQLSKLVLGQTGTTDVGQHVGTAKAHEHVKDDIERDDARQLANSLSDALVRPVVDLNLGPRPRYPRLRIARPDSTDLKLFMETVKTFVELGGEVEQSVVRDRIGLPDPPTGPQVKLLRPSPGGGGAPIEPAAPEPVEAAAIATAAQEHSAAPDGDAVDDLVARELENEGWRPLVDPIVRQIESVLGQCRTADEFLARLPELAAGLDTDALADRLGRAMIAARLAGEGEEELGGG